MKIEAKQIQAQKLQNKEFYIKANNIKPTFKELPDEFVSDTMQNASEHNGIISYIAAGIAAIGTGFAFFRNRKARIAKQIANNEKEIAQKTKTEVEDALARLKAENEAINKALDEWHEAIISPTKNTSTNKAGSTNTYSHGSSKSRGNSSTKETQGESRRATSQNPNKSESHNSNVDVKVSNNNESVRTNNNDAINRTKQTVSTHLNEEDKKYFEKEKQKLLELIDKSAMKEDAKQEWLKTIEIGINDIITNSKGIEEDKKTLSYIKEIVDIQLENCKMFDEYENKMHFNGHNVVQETLTKLAQKQGFSRILGYKAQKDFLNEKLIKPLKTNNEVPNIILMYGPKGTGKTLFGKAIAYEGQANLINLDLSIFPEENLQNLKDAVNKSKKYFEKTGKRSILLLNEVDGVECNKEYIDILNKLSKEFHATLIATTNYPKKVDSRILHANNFEKLYMPTSTKEDIAEILEYALKELSESNIDFNVLAKMLTERANGGAYSNAQIYDVSEQIIKSHYGEILDKKIGQKVASDFVPVSKQEIIEHLKQIKPDISKETIDSYKNIF